MKKLLTAVTIALATTAFASTVWGVEVKKVAPMQKAPAFVAAMKKTVKCKPEFTWTYGLTNAFVKRAIDPNAEAETTERGITFRLKDSAVLGANVHCYYNSAGSNDVLNNFGYFIPCNEAVQGSALHTYTCK